MKAWYLLYSKPRQEQVAKSNLGNQGYTVYLPMINISRRKRGRCRSSIEPLFPRYLFIYLDQNTDNWSPIRSTLGVSEIVRFGDKPALVVNKLIETLQSNDDENNILHIEEPRCEVGDQVRIVEGVMAGFEGVLTKFSGKERAALLLDYISKGLSVNVSVRDIEKI